MARWPDVEAMARATLRRRSADVGRARLLLAGAQPSRLRGRVKRDHGGVFPDTEEGLLALPGVGPYTAAAIAAIAFDRATMPVDGNIERVVSRLYAVEEPLPQAKPRFRDLAATLLARRAPATARRR